MIELDGVEYTVKTPLENTTDMLTTINDYCSAHDVRNSKNELVQLEARMSSPIYAVLWGLGYLVTVIQNLIYSVGKAHNVQSSSNKQLLNIADMANVKRGKPSVTTFTLRAQALSEDSPDYVEGQDCVITSDDTMTYQNIIYKPALHPSVTLQPGDVKYITMVAQSEGSYEVSAGAITAFDSTIVNLGALYQFEATPGQQQESIASLRERIQRKQYSGTTVDAAMDAIRELPGITVCNIYYNTDLSGQKRIGDDGIIVPARYALIIVQGYNDKIAQTFFEHLTCPTIDYDESTDTLDYRNITPERVLEVQWYVTHAQQRLPVLIVKPKQKSLYVKVYIGMSVVAEVESAMKVAVANLTLQLTAGQTVTATMVTGALADYTSYQILGAMVSSDGQSYAYKSAQAADVLWSMNTANIQIVMPEVTT